ncbi:unnamed protein product [Tilletia controversa]|nr:unnamed protein product [Tilletia controversa]CAD6921559.1 unnamed protein product [Tilletia controversa]
MPPSGKTTILAAFPWPAKGQLSEAQWTYLLRAAQTHGFRNPDAFQEWWERHFHASALDRALIPLFRRTLAGLAYKGLHPNDPCSVERSVAYSCLEDWAGMGLAELVFVGSSGDGRMGARLRLASMLMDSEAGLEEKSADLLWSALRPGSELPTPPLETPPVKKELEGDVAPLAEEKPSTRREEVGKGDDAKMSISGDSPFLPTSDTSIRSSHGEASIRNLNVRPPLPSPHAYDPTFEAGITFLDWRDPARNPPCLLANDEDPIVRLTTYFPADHHADVERWAAREGSEGRRPSACSSTTCPETSDMDMPESRPLRRRGSDGGEGSMGGASSGSRRNSPPAHTRCAAGRVSPKRRLWEESADEDDEHEVGEGGFESVVSKRLRLDAEHRARAGSGSGSRTAWEDELGSARYFPLLRLTSEPRR